jgi:hypothetical protein
MSKKLIHWLPRILGILFALFISIFALDAFGEGIPFREAVIGFLIHLLPTYIVIAVLLIAWKWELVGGTLFIFAGFFYIFGANNMHWSAYLLIAGPPILIGSLFIAAYFLSKKQ